MWIPEISQKSFLKRYPELKIQKLKCPNCGFKPNQVKLWIYNGYVGVDYITCECGKIFGMFVPISKEKRIKWDNLLLKSIE